MFSSPSTAGYTITTRPSRITKHRCRVNAYITYARHNTASSRSEPIISGILIADRSVANTVAGTSFGFVTNPFVTRFNLTSSQPPHLQRIKFFVELSSVTSVKFTTTIPVRSVVVRSGRDESAIFSTFVPARRLFPDRHNIHPVTVELFAVNKLYYTNTGSREIAYFGYDARNNGRRINGRFSTVSRYSNELFLVFVVRKHVGPLMRTVIYIYIDSR